MNTASAAPPLEVPIELLQAIELAQRKRKAREKLNTLQYKLNRAECITEEQFNEAIKECSLLH